MMKRMQYLTQKKIHNDGPEIVSSHEGSEG